MLLAATLAGCGVVFDAPKINLILRPGEIVYAEADGESQLVGGETVITVANSTPQERQVVLAHVPSGVREIPQELLDAERARDDDRILGFTNPLEPEEADYGAGGFGKKTAAESFHIYLAPGETYVLFDTMNDGVQEGLVAWLVPTPRGAE